MAMGLHFDKPSFFKFLIDDFATKLGLPPKFVGDYGKELLPNALLTTKYGKSWVVMMEPVGQRVCFTQGWSTFVKDNKLEAGDIVVFQLIGNSSFQVSMYGKSCCEKEIDDIDVTIPHSPPPLPSRHSLKNPGKGSQADARHERLRSYFVKKESESNHTAALSAGHERKSKNPTFDSVLRKHQKYIMNMPRGFARETRVANQEQIELLDSKGRKWKIKIICIANGTIIMSRGWGDFRKANRLLPGNTCRFELLEGDGYVLQVQVIKKPRMGRPPKTRTAPNVQGWRFAAMKEEED